MTDASEKVEVITSVQRLSMPLKEMITLRIRDVPPLLCRVVRQQDDNLALLFVAVEEDAREGLILRLMTEDHPPLIMPRRAESLTSRMLARLWDV